MMRSFDDDLAEARQGQDDDRRYREWLNGGFTAVLDPSTRAMNYEDLRVVLRGYFAGTRG